MACRVEMFGPMGAGKTTVLKMLSKSNVLAQNKNNVLTQRQIEKLEFLDEVRSNNAFKYFIYRLTFMIGAIEKKVIYKNINTASWRSVNLYKKLPPLEELWRATFCNRRYASTIDAEMELQRVFWFIKTIANCALVEGTDKAEIALQDESFIQRGIGFSFQDVNYLENLESYYKVIPLPSLAIHVTAPKSLLKARIEKRDGINSSAFTYLENSIELSSKVEKILKRRGCEVIKIINDNSISGNIESLAKRIMLLKH
jgi:hypothetical protein